MSERTASDETNLIKRSQQSGASEAPLIGAAIDHHLQNTRLTRSNLSVWDEELAFLQHLTQLSLAAAPPTWRRDELYER